MFDGLRDNITRLIALYESANSRVVSLGVELERKQLELEACRKQIEELESQVSVLRLREAFTAETTSTTAAKAKIDRLIGEIDKCIALLGK